MQATIDVRGLRKSFGPTLALDGMTFTVTPGHAPNAVRLALGLPTHDALRMAATKLAQLLASDPDATELTE